MNKKLIRLTESDLHRIVKESVNRVLTEMADDEKAVRITVPTMNIAEKLISYDDLIAFCNKHNLGIWDWYFKKFIPIEQYEYEPKYVSVGSYGLSTNHGFTTAPELWLVPIGTKCERGYNRLIFPNEN